MKDDPNSIRESLKALIAAARTNGQWLWCSYQDLWFSPDDLEKANAEGRFLWGPVNWRLRDPQERLRELERAADDAQGALNRFRDRLA